MTDEELKELIASLAIAQKKTDEQIIETNKEVKRVSTLLGNMGRNQGDIAEEFFFNSLVENAHLGAIHFDDITRNDTKHRGKIQEEYDLFMTNGDAVGIIEVKYKAHQSDLDKLERKMGNFKKLYPKYDDCKIYGALATFHINEDLKKATLERGFFILQQRGELVHTECGENLKVM